MAELHNPVEVADTNPLLYLKSQLKNGKMSLQDLERLNELMKNLAERQAILSLYPTPYLASDGRYKCRPYDGAEKRKLLVRKTREEAEDAIIAYHMDRQKHMTLEEAFERVYERRKDITENSVSNYRWDLRRFAGPLLAVRIDEITAADIEKAFLDELARTRPRKKQTSNYKTVLRRVFEDAERLFGCRVIDINDVIKHLNSGINGRAYAPRKSRMLHEQEIEDAFSSEEERLYIEAAMRKGTRNSLATVLLFYTGLRVGELCVMHKDSIHLDDSYLRVEIQSRKNRVSKEMCESLPKWNKSRDIIIPDVAKPVIRELIRMSPVESVYLLPYYPYYGNRSESPWVTDKMLRDEMGNICREIGMAHKSPHDARKTYDSRLDRVRLPKALRYMLMGHELTDIDEHYLRTNYPWEEMVDMVNEAFAETSPPRKRQEKGEI